MRALDVGLTSPLRKTLIFKKTQEKPWRRSEKRRKVKPRRRKEASRGEERLEAEESRGQGPMRADVPLKRTIL